MPTDTENKPKRKRTRRSISISGATYDQLRELCIARGLSMSGVVEKQIKEYLDTNQNNLRNVVG